MLAEYYQKRGSDPRARGYADVAGDEAARLGIARALCKINRLPDNCLDQRNIIGVTGGTGALNVALSIFCDHKSAVPTTVLVSDPFYPPWQSIAERLYCDFDTFPLREQDGYLPNENVLKGKLRTLTTRKRGGTILLIYHYPHNPTGKTLTHAEAIQVGQTLSRLCAEFLNLILVQEDLYLATTAVELGIYTPLAYLSEQAKQRTVWLHSPSKMGHQRDRAAVVAAFDQQLLLHLRGATSFDILGTCTPALMATANTLMHIAQGGLEPIDDKDSDQDNHRFVTARYYQERLGAFYKVFKEIEQATGKKLLPEGIPKGAYYLYPSFDLLRGKNIPELLLPVFSGKSKFENADDVAVALANAHLLGLRPITVASGTLFTRDAHTMHLRISTVEPDIENLRAGANTIKGLVQKTLSIELNASFYAPYELRQHYGAGPQKSQRLKPPFRWTRRKNGSGREWTLNP